jgi:hypothetical protein
MPFLARRFPQHLRKYEVSYRAGAYLNGAYPDRMAALVQAVREKAGIKARDLDIIPAPQAEQQQLLLF